MNFIKDERGGEGVEYPLVTVVVAGGAATGVMALKVATQAKTTALTASVTEVNNS
jgi:Flp pilus assembly pilin Flp